MSSQNIQFIQPDLSAEKKLIKNFVHQRIVHSRLSENQSSIEVKRKSDFNQEQDIVVGGGNGGDFQRSLIRLNSQRMVEKNSYDFNNQMDFITLVSITQKPHNKKTAKDLQILQLALKEVSFFKDLSMKHNMSNEVLLNIFKELHYEMVFKNQTIFRQDQIGKQFYIIIRGEVTVVKCTEQCIQRAQKRERIQIQSSNYHNFSQEKGTSQSSFKLTSQHSSQDKIPSSVKQKMSSYFDFSKGGVENIDEIDSYNSLDEIIDQEFEEEDEEEKEHDNLEKIKRMEHKAYLQTEHKECRIVNHTQAGGSFGEIALNNRVKRTATIIASKNTHLLCLSIENYRKFLKEMKENESIQKINVLLKTSLFKGFPEQSYTELAYCVENTDLQMNKILYKQGAQSELMYVIVSGELEFFKNIIVETPDPNQSNSNREENKNQIIVNSPKVRNIRLNDKKMRQVSIFKLGENQAFGYEEIINQQKRPYTVVCKSSECKLIQLSAFQFLHYVKNEFIKKENLQNSEMNDFNLQQCCKVQKMLEQNKSGKNFLGQVDSPKSVKRENFSDQQRNQLRQDSIKKSFEVQEKREFPNLSIQTDLINTKQQQQYQGEIKNKRLYLGIQSTQVTNPIQKDHSLFQQAFNNIFPKRNSIHNQEQKISQSTQSGSVYFSLQSSKDVNHLSQDLAQEKSLGQESEQNSNQKQKNTYLIKTNSLEEFTSPKSNQKSNFYKKSQIQEIRKGDNNYYNLAGKNEYSMEDNSINYNNQQNNLQIMTPQNQYNLSIFDQKNKNQMRKIQPHKEEIELINNKKHEKYLKLPRVAKKQAMQSEELSIYLEQKLNNLSEFKVDFDNPLLNLGELDRVALFQEKKAQKQIQNIIQQNQESNENENNKKRRKQTEIGISKSFDSLKLLGVNKSFKQKNKEWSDLQKNFQNHLKNASLYNPYNNINDNSIIRQYK